MEPELGLRLRLRLGLEPTLGCQGTDANRPKKLIPALGPHRDPTSSSSWSRGEDAVMMSWDKVALGSHITTGDALPATNSKKSLFAGREIRIFSMVKYVLREKRGTYLKDYNYQPAFSLVNQISFKLRLNAVTCLCSTTTHSEAPANEREEKYDEWWRVQADSFQTKPHLPDICCTDHIER